MSRSATRFCKALQFARQSNARFSRLEIIRGTTSNPLLKVVFCKGIQNIHHGWYWCLRANVWPELHALSPARSLGFLWHRSAFHVRRIAWPSWTYRENVEHVKLFSETREDSLVGFALISDRLIIFSVDVTFCLSILPSRSFESKSTRSELPDSREFRETQVKGDTRVTNGSGWKFSFPRSSGSIFGLKFVRTPRDARRRALSSRVFLSSLSCFCSEVIWMNIDHLSLRHLQAAKSKYFYAVLRIRVNSFRIYRSARAELILYLVIFLVLCQVVLSFLVLFLLFLSLSLFLPLFLPLWPSLALFSRDDIPGKRCCSETKFLGWSLGNLSGRANSMLIGHLFIFA